MNWQSCSHQPGEPDQNRAKDHQRSAISSRISSRSIIQKSRYHLVSASESRDAYWRDSRIEAVQPLRAGNRMGASLVRCPERASKSSARSGVIPAESRAIRTMALTRIPILRAGDQPPANEVRPLCGARYRWATEAPSRFCYFPVVDFFNDAPQSGRRIPDRR